MKTKKYDLITGHLHPYFIALKDLGLLKAGAILGAEQVEEILGCKYIDKDDWDFRGRYLTLKTQIEARGFFITQAEMEPPAFRILNTCEMAAHAMKKLVRSMSTNYKVSYILANHRGDELPEREKKQYESIKQRAATVAMMQQKVLLDDLPF